jgi:hypothetical protein
MLSTLETLQLQFLYLEYWGGLYLEYFLLAILILTSLTSLESSLKCHLF